ncbi:MAG: hypothetical protein LBG58_01350 [Planctomycetaceae bacterium]|jgi:hypothetical protein|nr:hypothetical protein [Planctomycetaceae bacterium]
MNQIKSIEYLTWDSLWYFSGEPVAAYQRGETEIPVKAVICSPTQENFNFEGFQLYNDSQIFEIKKSDLETLFPPKEGDKIIYNETEYPVQKSNGGPCWLDMGSYNVSVKVHTRRYRP